MTNYSICHKKIMKNSNIIIYGAGEIGQEIYLNLKEIYIVLFFIDKNHKQINNLYDRNVYSPAYLLNFKEKYDYIIVSSIEFKKEIKETLIGMGIPKSKIILLKENDTVKRKFMNLLKKSKIDIFRAKYWDMRANEIDERWGNSEADCEILENVISEIKPVNILDFGCGSGRLFKLYSKMDIKQVVGQDISRKALRLCKRKNTNLDFELQLFYGNINKLYNTYGENYFDLIISNRVMSAIIPDKINEYIYLLGKMSKNIYINELNYEGKFKGSNFWFKHNYELNMKKNNFIRAKGNFEKFSWAVYTKINEENNNEG